MEQILAHLVGDYILQTDRMAMQKTKSWLWACIHAFVYTLPFLFITRSPLALFAMFWTHAVIDHYRLARYVIAAKNALTDWDSRAEFFSSSTGYSTQAPVWMTTWLFIIADNTLHLLINYAAIRWL